MEQYFGFLYDPSHVCKLQRQLCGLKQASRAWYEKIDNFLISLGFNHCHFDLIAHTKRQGVDLLILVMYMDDLILIGSLHP